MKKIAALLILTMVAITLAPALTAEASCWLAVLACLSAAEEAYDKCRKDHFSVKCALALAKAITVCWNAYDECVDSSS